MSEFPRWIEVECGDGETWAKRHLGAVLSDGSALCKNNGHDWDGNLNDCDAWPLGRWRELPTPVMRPMTPGEAVVWCKRNDATMVMMRWQPSPTLYSPSLDATIGNLRYIPDSVLTSGRAMTPEDCKEFPMVEVTE